MELTHRVRVPAPLDEVWDVLNDPARLAVVLPGCVVDEVSGDTFTGSLKIKLGSSLLALAGDGRYVLRDRAGRRVVVETHGTDRRGDAGVDASHTLTLAPGADAAVETEVTVASSTTWTGRPGRLGQGVVADAVERVLDQTGSRVAARVAEGLPWAPPAAGAPKDGEHAAEAVVDHPVELGADLGDLGDAGDATRPAPAPSSGPAPRPPQPREYVYQPYTNAAEPHISAARTLGGALRKHVVPYAGLGALAVFAAVSAVRRARR